MTKFPHYLSFTVHYFYTWVSSLTQFFIYKICFELFLSAHFLFWEIRNLNLTFAVNVKFKLSNIELHFLETNDSDTRLKPHSHQSLNMFKSCLVKPETHKALFNPLWVSGYFLTYFKIVSFIKAAYWLELIWILCWNPCSSFPWIFFSF